MKLLINKSVIETAATDLARVIAQRNAIPILADIMCEVHGDTMTMTANDAEVMLKTTVPLEQSDGDGCFCVLAMRLTQALAPLPNQTLTITIDNDQNQMHIRHSRGETFFPIDNHNEYPTLADDANSNPVALDATALCNALKVTQWATALDELRKQLCGVYLNTVPEGLDVVATDGKCLVRYRLSDITQQVSVIIPKKVVKILLSILGDGGVTLTVGSKTGRISTARYTLTFLQIDARYPNYESVIPKEAPLTAELNRVEAISSIRCVMPFSDTTLGMLRVSLEDGKMNVSGQDTMFACGAEGNASVQYQEQNISIGLHGGLLLNTLTNIPAEQLRLRMTDAQHPLVIEPLEQPQGCNIMMMVMPMRLD